MSLIWPDIKPCHEYGDGVEEGEEGRRRGEEEEGRRGRGREVEGGGGRWREVRES